MRRSRMFVAPAVALSLWTAVPPIQWCPFSWDECWAATLGVATDCQVESAPCGEVCSASAPDCGASTCAPPPAADSESPSSARAYCLLAPTGGVPARSVETPAPSLGSASHPVAQVGIEPPRGHREVATDLAVSAPIAPPGGQLPPTRAPPAWS